MRKLQQLGGSRAPRITILALGTLAALALAVPASAAQKAPKKHRVQPVAVLNGMQVAIDPVTGAIRQPTAAESQALSAQPTFMAKAASGDPQVTTFADGTMSAVLPADFLNVWRVQINADGSLSQACVDGANAANANLATPALEEK
ncbi:MAG: hypothetical protein QOF89_804 [Acidobacteriota bacterium]|jgi:hypothetical protein|nr:hypothetical protein [Acidobacteriota bacterium]